MPNFEAIEVTASTPVAPVAANAKPAAPAPPEDLSSMLLRAAAADAADARAASQAAASGTRSSSSAGPSALQYIPRFILVIRFRPATLSTAAHPACPLPLAWAPPTHPSHSHPTLFPFYPSHTRLSFILHLRSGPHQPAPPSPPCRSIVHTGNDAGRPAAAGSIGLAALGLESLATPVEEMFSAFSYYSGVVGDDMARSIECMLGDMVDIEAAETPTDSVPSAPPPPFAAPAGSSSSAPVASSAPPAGAVPPPPDAEHSAAELRTRWLTRLGIEERGCWQLYAAGTAMRLGVMHKVGAEGMRATCNRPRHKEPGQTCVCWLTKAPDAAKGEQDLVEWLADHSMNREAHQAAATALKVSYGMKPRKPKPHA